MGSNPTRCAKGAVAERMCRQQRLFASSAAALEQQRARCKIRPKKWACRRMEEFCGRFSLAGKEEIRSKTHNMRLYSAKMCTTNLTQTVCLRLCGELFCFSGLTRSFSWTHGSGACPAPASSTAFSGQRPGPAGTAPCGCWPCPRLKNGGIQSHSSADQRRLPPE